MSTDAGNISSSSIQGIVSLIEAHQASQAAKNAGPVYKMPPEAGYEKALREYTSRLLAQSATSVAPSFTDWAKSGGTAVFPMGNTALTPGEATALGMVGKGGGAVPWMQPGQTQLTPDQIMFIAQQGKQAPGNTKRIQKEAKQEKRLQTMEGKTQTEGRKKKEAKLQSKLDSEISGDAKKRGSENR